MNDPAPGAPAQPPADPRGRWPDRASPAPANLGTFGMAVFLVALGVLFTASIVGYLFIRARAEAWPPPNSPPLPAGLWVSTVVILLCSVSIHRALSSIRRDRQGVLIGALLITLLLGMVFLVSQTVNWVWLISQTERLSQAISAESHGQGMQTAQSSLHTLSVPPTIARISSLYLFTFYVLTALHALHVIGGMVLLAVVTIRAFAGRYSAAYYPGVKYAAMYWHFLDVVWLVMFVLLFLL
jgi:cytochrome c oxidase subunit III